MQLNVHMNVLKEEEADKLKEKEKIQKRERERERKGRGSIKLCASWERNGRHEGGIN